MFYNLYRLTFTIFHPCFLFCNPYPYFKRIVVIDHTLLNTSTTFRSKHPLNWTLYNQQWMPPNQDAKFKRIIEQFHVMAGLIILSRLLSSVLFMPWSTPICKLPVFAAGKRAGRLFVSVGVRKYLPPLTAILSVRAPRPFWLWRTCLLPYTNSKIFSKLTWWQEITYISKTNIVVTISLGNCKSPWASIKILLFVNSWDGFLIKKYHT